MVFLRSRMKVGGMRTKLTSQFTYLPKTRLFECFRIRLLFCMFCKHTERSELIAIYLINVWHIIIYFSRSHWEVPFQHWLDEVFLKFSRVLKTFDKTTSGFTTKYTFPSVTFRTNLDRSLPVVNNNTSVDNRMCLETKYRISHSNLTFIQ